MTNSIGVEPLVLVLIIFVWTPPHFWALALDRKEEYADADIPMLPVTHGDAYTRRQILYYVLGLAGVSVLPFLTGTSGLVYLVGAVALAGRFLYWAVQLLRGSRENAPMATFRYSIVYLMALFVLLVADRHLVPAGAFAAW